MNTSLLFLLTSPFIKSYKLSLLSCLPCSFLLLTSKMCMTDDILGTVLSLYMHDSSQSLPTSEEVLICTSDTTAEEVGNDTFIAF